MQQNNNAINDANKRMMQTKMENNNANNNATKQ